VANAARIELGPNPERSQRATWLVHNGPGGTGQYSERKIFDRGKLSWFYQLKLSHDDFSEQKSLQDALIAAGIPTDEIHFGFVHPLINRWLDLPHPFSFDEPAILNLLEEFVDVALGGKVVKKLSIVIDRLNAAHLPIQLDEGTVIRNVTAEELWALGDLEYLESRHKLFPARLPDSDWKILEIKLQVNREEILDIERQAIRKEKDAQYYIFDAVLASLRLASSGWLRFIDMGSQNNFGINSMGHIIAGGRVPEEVGRYEGTFYLDQEMIHSLQNHWSKVLAVIKSDSHYLRLSALRLIEGGSRNQPRDALIDYSIGLESLLTGGELNELSYKFSLRGAMILGWYGEGRTDFYDNLKCIYRLRSSIVHGNRKIDQKKLNKAHHIAEEYLRKIWWWYFTKDIPRLDKGIDIIDKRILDP
jgi:hypothetical protein